MARKALCFFAPLVIALSSLSLGKEIELREGWNAFSVPAGYSISEQAAAGYADGEIYFALSDGKIRMPGEHNPAAGEGFWAYSSGVAVLEARGAAAAPGEYSIPLHVGWNFIANPYDFAVNVAEAVRVSGKSFRASRVVRPYIYNYRPELGGYVVADMLEPWNAYYIYSSEDATLEFSPIARDEDVLEELENLTVIDFLPDSPVSAGTAGEPPFISDQLLVSFAGSAGYSATARALRAAGFEVGGVNLSAGILQAKVNGMTLDAARDIISKLDGVAGVTKNYLLSPGIIPNDTVFTSPPAADAAWGFLKIGMPMVWGEFAIQRSAIVAVLDTGVDAFHPELQGRVLEGKNFVDPGAGANGGSFDDNGHGTNVAGIIAAQGGNGAGMAGVCWNCRILPVRVCGAAGQCPLFSVLNGISYAASVRAPVINLSLGGDFSQGSPVAEMFAAALDYAAENESIVVAAAGNNNMDAGNFFPASLPGAVAVGATDIGDARAQFSNYGATVDIAAPGVNIYTTQTGGGYAAADGTSMSAAFVSGVAALLYSADATLDGAALKNLILESPTDPVQGLNKPIGGRLNAASIFSYFEPLVNYAPIISRISVSPAIVSPGGQAALEVEAHDIEGEKMTYLWAASAGHIADPTARSTTWSAEGVSPGNHAISATVSDSRGASSMAIENVSVLDHTHSLVVTPEYAAAAIGETMRFRAFILDALGNEYPVTPNWEELSGLGEIDAEGLFTPEAAQGEAVIRATMRHLTAEARIRVYNPVANPMGGERGIELPEEIRTAMGTASGGSWSNFNTSAFLIGSVSVSVVFFESNGSIDPNLYNWTPAQKTHAIDQIKQGLDALAAQEPRANISFVYEAPITFNTGYEPVSRPSSQDGLYITEFMQSLGYAGNKWTATFNYNNFIRTKNNTHWAYTIFIVTGQPKFTDGWFAYAYIQGPYAMMTYQNDGWGPDMTHFVLAHETGHIFGAGDQYSGSCGNCTDQYGYLQGPNANCYLCPGSVSSLMKCDSLLVDPTTAVQIGWKDSDGDNVLDPVDPQNGGLSKIVVVPPSATVESGAAVNIKATLYNFNNHTIPGSAVNFSTNTGSVAPAQQTTYLEGVAQTTLTTACAEHTVQIAAPGALPASAVITGTCSSTAPKNLQATVVCPYVSLTWESGNDPEYDRYTVSRATAPGGPYTEIESGVENPFYVGAVPGDGTYYYVVHAYKNYDTMDQTGPSNEAAATVACASPPSNLAAMVECPDVKLTWNAAEPAEYDRYTVKRSASSGGPYAPIATGIAALEYTNTNPGDGTYYYIVNAYKSSDPAQQTGASNEATAVVACSGSTNGIPCDTEWPSFKCNNHRSGESVSAVNMPLTKLWEFETDYWVDSSPAVANGNVFVGSWDSKVYAFDQNTGEKVWEFETGDSVESSPAVAYGKVFIGSYDGNVYALNENTGAKIWEFQTGLWVTSSPTVADEKVFIGSWNSKVYALNMNTGEEIWEFTTYGYIWSSPTVADGKVFIGSNDSKVYALNMNSGAKIWEFATGDIVDSSPAVADGKVFIGSNDRKVYALDQNTGAKIWEFTTGDSVTSSPAVADGKVFIGSNDKKVYALDQNTGAKIWEYTNGSYLHSTAAVAGGKVFIGSNDNKVYALDQNTGAKVWEFTTGDWVGSSPAVANGKVFIGSFDNKLYAFGPEVPATPPSNLAATTECPNVKLTWNAAAPAEYDRYTVSRATVSGGPYTEIATGIAALEYTNTNPGDGIYYYIVNAYKSSDPDDETSASNQATAVVACSGSTNGIPCDTEWPSFKCNNHRSGESIANIDLPLKQAWFFTTGGSVNSTPAVADGMVFFGSWDKKVYAVNESNGNIIWQTETGGGIDFSSPAVSEGKVYIGSWDGFLYAFNQYTGHIEWAYDTNPPSCSTAITSSPAVSDGMVVFTTMASTANIYAVDQHTGDYIWHYHVPGKVSSSSPAVADGKVFYVASTNLYALNLLTGTKIWEFETAQEHLFHMPSVANGIVFIGVGNGSVHALSQNTGETLWEYPAGNPVYSFVTSGDLVYFGSGNKVIALNQFTGVKEWDFTTPLFLNNTHMTLADGKLFFLSGMLYVLDQFTGEELLNYNESGSITSSISAAGGRLFAGAGNEVIALETEPNAPPSNLVAEKNCPNVELTWDPASPSSYNRYTVSRAAASGGPYIEIATEISALSYTDANPGAGSYYYIVTAYKGAYYDSPYYTSPAPQTDPSNEANIVLSCAAPPANLTAEKHCPDVELTWDACGDLEYDRYTVSRATSPGGPYTEIATDIDTLFYTDDDPGDGIYFYVVNGYKSSNPAFKTDYGSESAVSLYCSMSSDESAPCDTEWPQYMCNNNNTGASASHINTPISKIWEFNVGSYVYSAPVVSGGKVLFGAGDNKLYALDEYSGTKIWEYSTGGTVSSSPAAANGKVFFGSTAPDTNVYALDESTGTKIWEYQTFNFGGVSGIKYAPAAAYGKVFASSGYVLYALDQDDGEKLWEFNAGSWIGSAPAVADGAVFIGSYNNKVYALDQELGIKLWEFDSDDCIDSSPSVADGRVFVATMEKVYALNQETGDLLWTFDSDGAFNSSFATNNGKLFFGSPSGVVYALDQISGVKIWEFDTALGMDVSPIVADGKVFVSPQYGYNHFVLDENTGSVIHTFPVPKNLPTGTAIANGKLYIGFRPGVVAAFGPEIPVTTPSNLAAVVECPDVKLTWNAAAPAEYDRYTVKRSATPGGPYVQIATGIAALEYTDTNPGDGTYYYIVNAYKSSNPADQTGPSNEATVVVSCATTNGVPCDAEWPSFRCNNHRSSESVSAVNLPLSKIWEFETGDSVLLSSPAVADGKVFIGSNDKKVYALDQNTGAKLWDFQTGGQVHSSPAMTDGKVFIGSNDKKVYALDKNTGAKIWEYTTGSEIYSSPAVADGKVFIGSLDSKVYALDQNTGAKIWEYTTGFTVHSSPAVADGKVFVGSYDNKVYALDQNTGMKIWEFETGYILFSSPAVADGKVFVGSYDNKVYALDQNTGAKIWEFETGYFVDSSPSVADGKVFIGSGDYKVYALDQNTGEKLFQYTTGSLVSSTPAVADGKMFIGSRDGKVYAFGPEVPATPPSNLAATTECPNVKLIWSAAAPAEYDRYTVKRSTTPGGPYVQIATGIAALEYIDSMPGEGLFYYVVEAYKSSDPAATTPLSNETYAEVACSSYLNVFGLCEPVLTWNPADDPLMDRFKLLRSETSGGPYSVVATNLTETSYQDSSVADNAAYHYAVVAYRSTDPSKESAPSNEVEITTACAPDDLVAAMLCPDIALKWEPSNGTEFDRFTLYRGTAAGGPYSEIATGLVDSSYTDTPPSSAGDAYYYIVRAYKSSNSAVTTDYSNEIVVANFICPYPEPTNLAAALDCPDVRLEWDGIPTASGYAVYRSLVSGGPYTQISSGVSSPYTDAAVVEGETYHYVVTAYYSGMAGEESAYSNEASMTVACSTVVQPSNLVAAVNCPDVELTWDAAAPAEYDRYTVSRAPASGGPYAQIATGIETLSYIDLDPGDGTYYYIVNAYKSGDPGYQTPASNEAAAVIACAPTPTVPKPPHPVNSTPVTGGITLEWTPPTENTDGTPLTDLAGYKVYRKTMPGGDYAWAQDLGSQTSWTDTSVTPGSEYCYVMTAVDSEIPANESAYSVETCGAPEGNIPYTYAFQCGNDIPPHFGAPTPEGELYVPYEATVDDEGNIYVTNKGNSRIEKYDANCNFIMKFGSTGSQPGKFGEPEGIVFNPANQLLYITDKYNRIQAFNKNGIYQFNWASNKTRSVAIDAAGGIYSITRISVGQEKVIQYTSAGAIISEWAAPGAQAAAIDASGRVYVTNAQQKRVDIYSGGALIGNFGTGLLDSPYGIHISPDGRVFVADSGAGNIQIFAPDGSHIDTVGESGFDVGQFTSPTDIWVVSNDRIIVVDNQHDRIQALIRE